MKADEILKAFEIHWRKRPIKDRWIKSKSVVYAGNENLARFGIFEAAKEEDMVARIDKVIEIDQTEAQVISLELSLSTITGRE